MSQEEKTSAPKADTPAPARNGGEATPFLAGAGMVGAAGGGSGASMATHASARRRPATSNGLACDLGRPAAGAAPLLASCKAYRVPWLPCCQACHGGCRSCGSGALCATAFQTASPFALRERYAQARRRGPCGQQLRSPKSATTHSLLQEGARGHLWLTVDSRHTLRCAGLTKYVLQPRTRAPLLRDRAFPLA